MIEHWRDISDTNGYYKVSNLGRLYSVRRDSILKPQINTRGYAQASLSIKGKRTVRYVHRLVFEAFSGKLIVEQIDHIDSNKLNNSIDNLRTCSRRDNQNYHHKKQYPGCHYDKKSKMWRAAISINKKTKWLGFFETPQEASQRYMAEKEILESKPDASCVGQKQ